VFATRRIKSDASPRAESAASQAAVRSSLVDPIAEPPDPRLLALADPQFCIRYSVLPWRVFGDTTVLLCTDLTLAQEQPEMLEAPFDRFVLLKADSQKLRALLLETFRSNLAYDAETALDEADSCRTWRSKRAAVFALVACSFGILCAFFFPLLAFGIAFGWVVLILLLGTALKLCSLLQKANPQESLGLALRENELPTISLLVPLFREADMTGPLTSRLTKLDYPRGKLDLCFVVENDDLVTKSSISKQEPPDWMRVIEVPKGKLRTKPRALNYALNFVSGSIVGVYDAEDAPESDQLRHVAETFARAGPDVACVQGRLDYYNDAGNWLSRCFTLEYASWFRVILPGYAKMGLLVPLGGTTLFFRRDTLNELRSWDAHNVTEDADLGVRLARRGYRTVFMLSVTNEEANARAWPWIKQRSRWLKGYAVTYAVHMRRPLELFRQLGAWRFFGFQVLFLGTLSPFLLAPLLWTVVVIPFGLPHPLFALLSRPQFVVLTAIFLLSTCINLATNCIGAHRAGKSWLMKWAPTMVFYFPLATLGALKGLSELFWRPFFWDKTAHGIDLSR